MGIFSLKFSYNDIRMPQPFENASILLVGPKFEFSFTKSLFWSTFIQYNSQAEILILIADSNGGLSPCLIFISCIQITITLKQKLPILTDTQRLAQI